MAKKKLNKKMSKLGKAGIRKRFAKRYEILVELSKHYDKRHQNWFTTWRTPQLQELLNQILK
jgi:hypothetical protein